VNLCYCNLKLRATFYKKNGSINKQLNNHIKPIIMKIITKFALLSLLLFAFISCQKPAQPDAATGRDISNADRAVSDVFAFAMGETGGKNIKVDECFTSETVANVDTSWTTTITFTNCLGQDGTTRNGKIILVWKAGWMRDSTKITTVTFDDYSINNDTIAGTLEFSYVGGTVTNPIHKIVEKNMKITFSNGDIVTWEGTRNIEWLEGFLTFGDKTDNKHSVDIYKDGYNRKGEHYIAETSTTPLIVSNTCGDNKTHVNSGIITITKEDGTVTTIDFGTDDCEDSFTVTQNGISIVVNP